MVEVCLVRTTGAQQTVPVNILLTTGQAPANPNKDPATGKSLTIPH